jgi:hypothetical protein
LSSTAHQQSSRLMQPNLAGVLLTKNRMRDPRRTLRVTSVSLRVFVVSRCLLRLWLHLQQRCVLDRKLAGERPVVRSESRWREGSNCSPRRHGEKRRLHGIISVVRESFLLNCTTRVRRRVLLTKKWVCVICAAVSVLPSFFFVSSW